MPIRRRSDGEIVEEATEPLKKPIRGHPQTNAEEAITDPLKTRGKRDKDSLFRRAEGTAGRGNRLEEPTVAIGSSRQPEDGKTRILTPRGKRKGAAGQVVGDKHDPMLDPPVAWLVIVGGPGKGRVLTLGNGMNSIGRGESTRVRVNFGDDTIARSNHARLAYEPRNRRYLLSHGEGSNLTYVNGEVVMDSIEIESGAVIEIGATKLRFQAFCSKDFDWPDVDE